MHADTAEVALPLPIRKTFIYRLPGGARYTARLNGARVIVPFGRRRLLGFICGKPRQEDAATFTLKTIDKILDDVPLYTPRLYRLLDWAASYYQTPLGMVLAAALPVALRKGRPAELATIKTWQISNSGLLTEPTQLRSTYQRTALAVLAREQELSQKALGALDIRPASMEALVRKGLAEVRQTIQMPKDLPSGPVQTITLTTEQEAAARTVMQNKHGYKCYLLEGPTNSGKTEAYIAIMKQMLQEGGQVLYLVPEISLSPQTLGRLKSALNIQLGVIHSGLNQNERLQHYLLAAKAKLNVIVGTRSAIFTPMPNLGCIIVDEEQDASYKQQDGFHYNGKHLAIKRAQQLNIPIVLGTATPALESLHNAARGYYQHLRLPSRTQKKKTIRVLDMAVNRSPDPLSGPVLDAIADQLKQKHQVLIFVNRRGFATILRCQKCGWICNCQACAKPMILHKHPPMFICHLCDARLPIVTRCPSCESDQLLPLGSGTQRIEEDLKTHFAEQTILRIDRDSMRRKDAYAELYRRVHGGAPAILVGTQILAKGHDFANVTLGVIINCDQALLNPDFYATESFAQVLVQVIGRIGRRAGATAEALIPSYYPKNELLMRLLHEGYQSFAQKNLTDRRRLALPPYSYLAYLRAESKQSTNAAAFLTKIKERAQQELGQSGPTGRSLAGDLLGPHECAIAKKAGYYRSALIIKSNGRARRAAISQRLRAIAEDLPEPGLRWHLELDPMEAA